MCSLLIKENQKTARARGADISSRGFFAQHSYRLCLKNPRALTFKKALTQ